MGTAIKKHDEKRTDEKVKDWLESHKADLEQVLPRHVTAGRLARVALGSIRRTPKLGECSPRSLIASIMEASVLGLEIGTLGAAYLVPFRDKRRGMEATLIVGYRGLIDLARRSGQIVSIHAYAVVNGSDLDGVVLRDSDGDHFRYALGLEPTVEHVPAPEVDRTDPRLISHAYAVAKLVGGGTQFVVLTRAEIEQVRKQSRAGRSGPWVTHWIAMALKTAVRRLAKFLPMSVEMQRMDARETAIDLGLPTEYLPEVAGAMDTIDADGEVIDEGEAVADGAMTEAEEEAAFGDEG